MATFDPFSEVQNFANQVLSTRNGLEQMPMDLFRRGSNYYLAADLPGIDPGHRVACHFTEQIHSGEITRHEVAPTIVDARDGQGVDESLMGPASVTEAL